LRRGAYYARLIEVVVAVGAFLVAFFVAAPLLTLLHELGHVAAVVLSGGRATVTQGREPSLLRFSMWRLDFRLRPLVDLGSAWFGFFHYEGERASRARRVLIIAAGPVTSLLAYLALALLASGLSYPVSWFVWAAATGAGVQVLVTALPIRYGRMFGHYRGSVSDGRRILELARGRG
jgi:hypothetical protein